MIFRVQWGNDLIFWYVAFNTAYDLLCLVLSPFLARGTDWLASFIEPVHSMYIVNSQTGNRNTALLAVI